MTSLFKPLLASIAFAALLLASVACADDRPSRDQYFIDCSDEDVCEAPYQCVSYEDRRVCLIPCQTENACPEGCLCKNKGGDTASVGPDCHCICV